jgi:hypothetical protein
VTLKTYNDLDELTNDITGTLEIGGGSTETPVAVTGTPAEE